MSKPNEKNHDDFRRFLESLKGLNEFEKVSAYHILIGAMQSNMNMEDYRRSINVTISHINKHMRREAAHV